MKNSLAILISLCLIAVSKPAFAEVTSGKLEVIKNVISKDLGNARNLRIWLPDEYFQSPTKRFPVVYFHDGQNGFESETSNGGSEWELDETVSRLAANEHVGPVIIVGLDSVIDSRDEEYEPGLKEGQAYMRFIVEEVKPLIDSKYRTLADRESTFSVGSSSGANISLGLVWAHADVFSAGAGLSLSAMDNHEAVIKFIDSNPRPSQKIRFYMDHGTKRDESGFEKPARKLYSSLTKQGLDEDDLVYRIFPGAGHNERDWAKRVAIPLRWLLTP